MDSLFKSKLEIVVGLVKEGANPNAPVGKRKMVCLVPMICVCVCVCVCVYVDVYVCCGGVWVAQRSVSRGPT
jgi:hypothetical protein